jgi:hypothetical protein
MNSTRPHMRRVALHTYVAALLLSNAVAAHADITLFISDSEGVRGGTAPVTVSLQGDGRDIAGIDIDLLVDAAVFGAPAHVTDICAPAASQVHICFGGSNNFQQCATNAECPEGVCRSAFAISGTVDIPTPPEGKHRLALSITQPIMDPPPPPIPLGNGALIVCNLSVLSDAPLGTTVVAGSGPAAFDSSAMPLTPISIGSAEGETGTVTISEAPTPTNTPTITPTNTPLPDTPTVTPTNTPRPNTPTVTPTNTPRPNTPTVTPTNTVPPNTATPTRTNTVRPTATLTSPPAGGGADDDSCAISRTRSGASLLWLLIPPAVMVWRRRR